MFNAFIIPPAGDTRFVDIEDGRQVNELVGGYFQLVPVPARPGVAMYVNEDGQMLNLDPNIRATILAGTAIVGTAVVFSHGGPNDPNEHDAPPEFAYIFPPELTALEGGDD